MGVKINLSFMLKTIFPLLFCKHNYITSFIVLYLLMGFINKFVSVLSKHEYIIIIFMLTIFLSVIPSSYSEFNYISFSYLGYMILLYLIGGYINIYGINIRHKIILLILGIVIIVLLIVFPYLLYNISTYNWLTGVNNIVMLIIAVLMFDIFLEMNIKYNKFINIISNSILGVYLIHDDLYMRNIIWNKFVIADQYMHYKWYFLYIIIGSVAVFVSCIIIDKIFRIFILNHTLWCDRYLTHFIKKIKGKLLIND